MVQGTCRGHEHRGTGLTEADEGGSSNEERENGAKGGDGLSDDL